MEDVTVAKIEEYTHYCNSSIKNHQTYICITEVLTSHIKTFLANLKPILAQGIETCRLEDASHEFIVTL